MSIQSEIDRISENVASSYAAISSKGGIVPETQNSDNLPEAIDSIPTGPGYTIDDTLTLDGDTLSVTTPVRGIYTQEEFDALPEAQRNKGMYVVDDGESGGGTGGGTGGGSNDVYSMEETRIGTWIDGRPLYRRVFQAVLPAGMNQWKPITGVYLGNPDTLVSLSGCVKNIKGGEPAQRTINDLSCQIAMLGNNQIGIFTQSDWYGDQPAMVIAEYTKTTDSEVSA